MLGLYEIETVLALWDIFLNSDDDWIRRAGHKVSEFQRQIPVLLDHDWKSRAKKYQTESGVVQIKEEESEGIESIKDVLKKLAE